MNTNLGWRPNKIQLTIIIFFALLLNWVTAVGSSVENQLPIGIFIIFFDAILLTWLFQK